VFLKDQRLSVEEFLVVTLGFGFEKIAESPARRA
jgi:hypothetical protein